MNVTMNVGVKPLPRELYARAKKLNVTKIFLEFRAGHAEGILEASIEWSKKLNEQTIHTVRMRHGSQGRIGVRQVGPYLPDSRVLLNDDIQEWMEQTWDYSGADDGTSYGDDLTYDLVENTVEASQWRYERTDFPCGNEPLLVTPIVKENEL
jgi:hypothetical protein